MRICEPRPILLVVDDDAAIREALHEVLESEGYEVFVAADGKQAIEILEEIDGRPCLVLCDHRMPFVSGEEFLKRLRSDPQKKDIPVTIITASPPPPSMESKADGVIRKPFDIDQLLGEVRKYCATAV